MKTSLMIGDHYSKEKDGYPVYYRVTDTYGKRILIASGIYTTSRFTGTEFPIHEMDAELKTTRVRSTIEKIDRFCRMNRDVYGDDLKKRIAEHIGKQYQHMSRPKLLTDFIYEYADGMKPSTAKLYALTAKRIIEFDKKARLCDVTPDWLCRFERYLMREGISVNGIAQKMRNIRAVFNNCINDGYRIDYPFKGHKGYRIREELSVPNDMSAEDFARLRDYPVEPWQQIYKDMFLLTFYLAGINAGDLLYCKGLKNGRLVFVRRKTDKVNARTVRPISLPVYPEAMAIIEKYKGKDYLLNVMDRMKDHKTFLQHWNQALKKIGPNKIVKDKLGKLRKIEYMPLFPDISTYTARYTFASIAANELDISDSTIGKCLGHSWASGKNVTSRYISHDQKKIDLAIRKVIDFVNSK